MFTIFDSPSSNHTENDTGPKRNQFSRVIDMHYQGGMSFRHVIYASTQANNLLGGGEKIGLVGYPKPPTITKAGKPNVIEIRHTNGATKLKFA